MFYISRDKGRNISVSAARSEIRETTSGPPMRLNIPGKRILFKPYAGKGFVTSALPVKYGRTHAEGYFDSTKPKMRPGLSQQEAEEFLAKHEDYGVDFVAIGDDGSPVAAGEWGTPMKRSEPYISQSGDGYHCSLCDKQLGNRGLQQHCESNKHVAFLEQAERGNILAAKGIGG